ncbi:alpha/beta fold hydrolase [Massilia niastensis]|uniref:alpha/beta fold hydrolase n=1 Tax=Massilia niastensis TaxID=544911 RepID=UPI00036E62D0|nr:alpha/beta fold hydrolase [Massilia niastensis]
MLNPNAIQRGASFLLDVDGAAPINCRIDGREGAPWLVFSNSHATNFGMWEEQVSHLAGDYSILRYDQRGHGATPADPGQAWTFDALADDVVRLLDALAIGRATLVGVSMGAVTVLRCAARHGARVERVIACDGQWAAPAAAAAAWQERIDLVGREGMAAIAEPTVARWFTPGFGERAPQARQGMAAMIAATPLAGYVGCARAMQAYDFSADYPRLGMPVRYLVGAEDGALPAVMERMRQATPGATLVRIPGAGHLPNIEQPRAFNQALSAALAG